MSVYEKDLTGGGEGENPTSVSKEQKGKRVGKCNFASFSFFQCFALFYSRTLVLVCVLVFFFFLKVMLLWDLFCFCSPHCSVILQKNLLRLDCLQNGEVWGASRARAVFPARKADDVEHCKE